MIEEFNENGESGIRLTDHENDRKIIDMWLRDLMKEKSYLETIERLEVKNRKLRKSLYAAVSISIAELLLLLAVI